MGYILPKDELFIASITSVLYLTLTGGKKLTQEEVHCFNYRVVSHHESDVLALGDNV